ncbi:MAG: hypothetical protein KIT84_01850 [Labilithrix sp.]|nr:hypothetical protein [Labilithrix sp.]MCW5809731.1 hypothetical protein [Labilithrix sp.]
MKLAAVLAALSVTAALAGCAAPNDADAPAASSEVALTTFTPLDRVTPAEVAAAYAEDVSAHLETCRAAHPSIAEVDRDNLRVFARVGNVSYFDVSEAIEALLDERGLDAIAPGEVPTLLEPLALRELGAHVDGDGFYAPPREGQLQFYYAELHAREAKAHALATAPGGKSFTEIRALWRNVQSARNTLDSSWLRPQRVSAEPSLTEIRKAMRVPFDAHFESWGNTAVAEFGEAHEGPNGTPAFAPLATFLESDAIKKRWLFQAYDASGSTNILVVLDEHDQLWGMQMGYSE